MNKTFQKLYQSWFRKNQW